MILFDRANALPVLAAMAGIERPRGQVFTGKEGVKDETASLPSSRGDVASGDLTP
jgi:hypothetical protein